MADLPMTKVFSIGDLDFYSFGNFQAGGDTPHNPIQTATQTAVEFYDVYEGANFAQYSIAANYNQNDITVTFNSDNSANITMAVTATRNRTLLTQLPPDDSGPGWSEFVAIDNQELQNASGPFSTLPLTSTTWGSGTYSFTVAPQTYSSDLNGVHWIEHITYTGEDWFDDFAFGLKVFNNRQAAYRPMDIRKGTDWQSLNRSTGFLNIRKSGAWQEIPLLNYSDEAKPNVGSSRIRKSGVWNQQSKIGSE